MCTCGVTDSVSIGRIAYPTKEVPKLHTPLFFFTQSFFPSLFPYYLLNLFSLALIFSYIDACILDVRNGMFSRQGLASGLNAWLQNTATPSHSTCPISVTMAHRQRFICLPNLRSNELLLLLWWKAEN